MTKAKKKNSVLNGLASASRKMAQNIYVKSLQSGFASLVPAMILTSVGTLLSAFIFNDGGLCAGFLNAEILANIRSIATSIANGTTQMLSILAAISISYYFQKSKNFSAVHAFVQFSPSGRIYWKGTETQRRIYCETPWHVWRCG
mgnify:CR=1 FL=1